MTLAEEAVLAKIVREFNTAENFAILQKLAKPHVESEPIFDLLPYDPANPMHDLSQVSFEPDLSNIEEVIGLLDVAYKDWRQIILHPLLEREDLLDHLQILIESGGEFSMVSAHQHIKDIALAAAGFVVAMHISGRVPYEVMVQRIHIVISSIIRAVGAFGSPAGEVLRKIGHVHFSFPRTESMRRGGFPDDLVRSANQLVRLQIARASHKVLAVAGPGSVDKVVGFPAAWAKKVLPDDYADEHITSQIQPLGKGTVEIISGLVVPIAAVMTGPEQFCLFGRITRVGSMEDGHALMKWIARERTKHTGIPTYSHKDSSKFSRPKRL